MTQRLRHPSRKSCWTKSVDPAASTTVIDVRTLAERMRYAGWLTNGTAVKSRSPISMTSLSGSPRHHTALSVLRDAAAEDPVDCGDGRVVRAGVSFGDRYPALFREVRAAFWGFGWGRACSLVCAMATTSRTPAGTSAGSNVFRQ